AANVLAQNADAFLHGAIDDTSAVGKLGLRSFVSCALSAHLVMIAFPEQDHAAIRLRKQSKQVIEELAKQGILIECPTEMLRDLQHDLQLVAGVLRVQVRVRGDRIESRANDGLSLRETGRRIRLERENVWPDLDIVARLQRRAPRDALAIEEGAV